MYFKIFAPTVTITVSVYDERCSDFSKAPILAYISLQAVPHTPQTVEVYLHQLRSPSEKALSLSFAWHGKALAQGRGRAGAVIEDIQIVAVEISGSWSCILSDAPAAPCNAVSMPQSCGGLAGNAVGTVAFCQIVFSWMPVEMNFMALTYSEVTERWQPIASCHIHSKFTSPVRVYKV